MTEKPDYVPEDACMLIVGAMALGYGNKGSEIAASLCKMLDRFGYRITAMHPTDGGKND